MARDHLHPLGRGPGGARREQLDPAIIGAALIGGAIGFLWFNAFPAEVFMGDTGSMALGGALRRSRSSSRSSCCSLLIGGDLRDRGALGDAPGRRASSTGADGSS